jgi:hypothetical protein
MDLPPPNILRIDTFLLLLFIPLLFPAVLFTQMLAVIAFATDKRLLPQGAGREYRCRHRVAVVCCCHPTIDGTSVPGLSTCETNMQVVYECIKKL